MGSFNTKDESTRRTLERRAAAFGWYPIVAPIDRGDAERASSPHRWLTDHGVLSHLRSESGTQIAENIISASECRQALSPSGERADAMIDFSRHRLLRHRASTAVPTSMGRGGRLFSSWTNSSEVLYAWRPVELLLFPADMDVIAMLLMPPPVVRGKGEALLGYGTIVSPENNYHHRGGDALVVPDCVYKEDVLAPTTTPPRSGCHGLSLAGHREVGPVHLARLLRGGDSLIFPPTELFKHLSVLDLSGTSIGDRGVLCLAKLLFAPRCSSSAGDWGTSSSHQRMVTSLAEHYPVRELILSDCEITDTGCGVLASALLRCLHALEEERNPDDDEGSSSGAYILEEVHSPSSHHPPVAEPSRLPATSLFLLAHLSLSHNRITDVPCILLGQLLAHPYGVGSLDLCGNCLGDDGVVEVVANLQPRLCSASEAASEGNSTALIATEAHRPPHPQQRESFTATASSPIEAISRLRRSIGRREIADDNAAADGPAARSKRSCSPSLNRRKRGLHVTPHHQNLTGYGHTNHPAVKEDWILRGILPSKEERSTGLCLDLGNCSQTTASAAFLVETLLAAHDERVLRVLADIEALQQRVQTVDFYLHLPPTSARGGSDPAMHCPPLPKGAEGIREPGRDLKHSTCGGGGGLQFAVTALTDALVGLYTSPVASLACYLTFYTHGLRRLSFAHAPIGDAGVSLLCNALCRIATSSCSIANQLSSTAGHARRVLSDDCAQYTRTFDHGCSVEESKKQHRHAEAAELPIFTSSVVFLEELDLTNVNASEVTCAVLLNALFSTCACASSGDATSSSSVFRAATLTCAPSPGRQGVPIRPLCASCTQPYLRVLRLARNGRLGGSVHCGELLGAFCSHACRGWAGLGRLQARLSTDPFSLGSGWIDAHPTARRPALLDRPYVIDLEGCGVDDDAVHSWMKLVNGMRRGLAADGLGAASSCAIGCPPTLGSLVAVNLDNNHCTHGMLARARDSFEQFTLHPFPPPRHDAFVLDDASSAHGASPDRIIPARTSALRFIDCSVEGNSVVMRSGGGGEQQRPSGCMRQITSWHALDHTYVDALKPSSRHCSFFSSPPDASKGCRIGGGGDLKQAGGDPLPPMLVAHPRSASTPITPPPVTCDDPAVFLDMTHERVDALIRASEDVMLRWDV